MNPESKKKLEEMAERARKTRKADFMLGAEAGYKMALEDHECPTEAELGVRRMMAQPRVEVVEYFTDESRSR